MCGSCHREGSWAQRDGWLTALQMYTLLPRNLEQLQQFRGMLLAYTEENYGGVLLVFSLLYIFKQTFSIPGSVLMNVVGGALLGLPVGFPLCCLLSAVGASCCFWLSHFIGEPVVSRVMGTKLKQLRTTIVSTDSLLLYLIFIRIFPITPNWAINLASPLIHVPFVYFFLSVFLGESRRMQCWLLRLTCQRSHALQLHHGECWHSRARTQFHEGRNEPRNSDSTCWRFSSVADVDFGQELLDKAGGVDPARAGGVAMETDSG